MRVKSQNKARKTKPSMSLEFDTDFEQDKFIEFLKKLQFDGINYKLISGIGKVSLKPKFCLTFNTLADYTKFVNLQKALPEKSQQASLFTNQNIKSDLELEIDRLAQQSKAQAEAQKTRQAQEKKLSEFALVKSKLENGQPISAELRRKYPDLVKKYEELDLISGLGNHSFYNQISCKCRTEENNLGLSIGALPQVDELKDLKPVAYLFPISEIKTDAKRFQNRTDAFSELSAESVAKNYNSNIFDPIVIWFDEAKKTFYVLSGHSRLEGMKRRGAKFIPARFFKGTESEAIVFARVDANRAATKESLIEDLKAYRLMRDGDMNRNIAPASKPQIKQAFKNKAQTLEALSFLNQKGKFIEALSIEDNQKALPRLELFATWVGNFRKQYPNFTNTWEDDCFNFFYSSDKNWKIRKEDFEAILRKRISYGKSRLFPECEPGQPCKDIKDFSELPPNGHLYKDLENLQESQDFIRKRFNSNKPELRVYTTAENDKLKEVLKDLQSKSERLKRDLGVVEQQQSQGLFGISGMKRFFEIFPNTKIIFNQTAAQKANKLGINELDIKILLQRSKTVVNHETERMRYFIGFHNTFNERKFISGYFVFDNAENLLILDILLPGEKLILEYLC